MNISKAKFMTIKQYYRSEFMINLRQILNYWNETNLYNETIIILFLETNSNSVHKLLYK